MNKSQEAASKLTKRQILAIIGDEATFAKRKRLPRMKLTRKMEFLMFAMRIYIIIILIVIILSLLGII